VSAKHTPGPYHVNGKTALGWRIDSVAPDAPVGIEMLTHPVAIVPKKENADFLATAPDMLSMLERIIDKYSASLDSELAEEAKLVIRRAWGDA
jgi:hypothetical protein